MISWNLSVRIPLSYLLLTYVQRYMIVTHVYRSWENSAQTELQYHFLFFTNKRQRSKVVKSLCLDRPVFESSKTLSDGGENFRVSLFSSVNCRYQHLRTHHGVVRAWWEVLCKVSRALPASSPGSLNGNRASSHQQAFWSPLCSLSF